MCCGEFNDMRIEKKNKKKARVIMLKNKKM